MLALGIVRRLGKGNFSNGVMNRERLGLGL